MKAALISLGSVSSKWTYEEMKKVFDEVDFLNISKIEINLGSRVNPVLYDEQPLKDYDCVYIKGSFRYAPIQRSLSTLLQNRCYLPIKPSAYTVAHNKLLSQLKFQTAKIPMPITYLSSSVDAGKNILKTINYPIIMKFVEGTQGKGVMFADSYASASSILDALTSLKQPFIIQEYIETNATDIRVIVIGNEVAAAIQRKGVKGEKRSNIHAGGEGLVYKVDDKTKKIAVAAAKSIGADICAVDILESHKGPLVIEINISPGLQGITNTTSINVAEKIAKYLHKKSKEFKELHKVNGTKEIISTLDSNKCDNILTTLDMRGNRILLPELVTKISKITEDDEVTICAEKGKISLNKN